MTVVYELAKEKGLGKEISTAWLLQDIGAIKGGKQIELMKNSA